MDLAEYIRMSTDKQEDSPETQQQIIREYCHREGHAIIKTYQDSAISGGYMDGRASLRELLRDAERKVFEGVIIYKLDRAFRNLGEQVVVLRKLKNLGIKLLAVADPLSEGAAGDLVANILGAVNQFERELTGERIRDHNRELAKKGRWTGGTKPSFGYGYNKETKEVFVVPEEAETVRKLVEIFKETKGTSSVAWRLNALGLKSSTGLTWNPGMVHNVLNNPYYMGKVRYGYRKEIRDENGKLTYKKMDNYELFQGTHEPLISENDFNEIQEIFKGKNTLKRSRKQFYVFSGTIKCSLCGGPLVGQSIPDRGKRYRCWWHANRNHVCKGLSIYERVVEDKLHEEFKSLFEMAKSCGQVMPREKSKTLPIEKLLKELDHRLQREIDIYRRKIITADELAKQKEAIDKEREFLLSTTTKQRTISKDETIKILSEFIDIWEFRWDNPIGYRNLIKGFMKEIYIGKEKITIIYHSTPDIPDWPERKEIALK